jgi:hypothetical protein
LAYWGWLGRVASARPDPSILVAMPVRLQTCAMLEPMQMLMASTVRAPATMTPGPVM